MEKIIEAIKEQEWIVGESGKSILEYIVKKLDILQELYETVNERLDRLDEQNTLRQEIQQLQDKIADLEEEQQQRQGYQPLVAPPPQVTPPCTAHRNTWPDVTQYWNNSYATGTGTFTTDSGSPSWSYTGSSTGPDYTVTTATMGSSTDFVSRDMMTGHETLVSHSIGAGVTVRIADDFGYTESFTLPSEAHFGTEVEGSGGSKGIFMDDGRLQITKKNGAGKEIKIYTSSIYGR
jgi:hypothetical protein